MDWVELGRDFSIFGGLAWVNQLMGWVGLVHTKWTHGQLCCDDLELRPVTSM